MDENTKRRARGSLLGLAVGDALGAGYEFGPPMSAAEPVSMKGGGPFNWAPGEWTDDTSMSVVIARVIATYGHLGPAALDQVVRDWCSWAQTSPDVGNQTASVLFALGSEPTAAAARAQATAYARRNLAGGNGCLMRTAPVALATLGDPEATFRNAVAVARLTHADRDAVNSAALWSVAVGEAIVTGELPTSLSDAPKTDWLTSFCAVGALQAAWHCARNATSYKDGVEAAVRLGGDTDTVAAITGSLLGAVFPVPLDMAAAAHGWPGMTGADLADLADLAVTKAGRSKRWTEPPTSY